MIKVAKSAGFCMGVRRALDIVLDLVRKGKGPIYTDGPLIHNPQIIDFLEGKGVRPLRGTVARRGMIVIRAHGISPARRERLGRMGVPVYDATCPDVAKVQALVKKYSRRGYRIVIVGDRGHAEVEGLMGFSKGLGTVVSSVEDAEALPPGGKVCVVAQTTQDLDVFEGVARRINERASACVVCDTVCRSTRERQKETIAMARATDAMVVVGGRSSANTARLVKICEKVGVPVFHVESERELNDIPLHRYGRIGVTAGASTPRAVIERVVEAIRAQRAPQVRRSYRARRRS